MFINVKEHMNYKQFLAAHPKMANNVGQLRQGGQQAIRQDYRAGGNIKGMAGQRLANQAQRAPAMQPQVAPPPPQVQQPQPQVTAPPVQQQQQQEPDQALIQAQVQANQAQYGRSMGMPWAQPPQQYGGQPSNESYMGLEGPGQQLGGTYKGSGYGPQQGLGQQMQGGAYPYQGPPAFGGGYGGYGQQYGGFAGGMFGGAPQSRGGWGYGR